MISNKKVRLMTNLAIYEKNHSNDLKLSRYYKSDYVRYYILRTVLNVTFAYVCVLLLIALYNIESLVANAATLDYSRIGMYILIVYLALLAAYIFISIFVYSNRYGESKKRLNKYYKKLKTLNKIYKNE